MLQDADDAEGVEIPSDSLCFVDLMSHVHTLTKFHPLRWDYVPTRQRLHGKDLWGITQDYPERPEHFRPELVAIPPPH